MDSAEVMCRGARGGGVCELSRCRSWRRGVCVCNTAIRLCVWRGVRVSVAQAGRAMAASDDAGAGEIWAKRVRTGASPHADAAEPCWWLPG